ncbi:MAG: VPLPA-CTERM sorting domain-containing protein [Pseudotabrizicola sp.]|uniref:VPLPA-CTERM sorting domain-containing protein n=1 Tax=Pseudotabrizicola sp. TaxID=2939647 RepID=UPI002716046E|nr:VPLPA-CTERM sorting domain-containing protein [Pseudotabrizicola sp.]MDO9639504.1 VPLPA-CTERM sorting domain-containing protein [Pseudotabrizicola sp.]
MRVLSSFGVAVALCAALLSPASAATVQLGSFTHNYGSNPGNVNPGGTDALSGNYVTVSDQSSGRFFDSFNFSALQIGATVESLALTLAFSGAGPNGLFGLAETWRVRVQGSNSGASFDDYFAVLRDPNSPQTFTLSAATDTGWINAFATSLLTGTLTFWFSEETLGADNFKLTSASLAVYGTPAPSVVPLPAGGFLLIGALGGLAALRRRKRQA